MENFAEISQEKPKQTKLIGKFLIGTSAAVARKWISKSGYIYKFVGWATIAVGISVVCFPFVSPALRRFTLPFIPATDNQLKNIMKVLPKTPTKNDRVLDIGSGDGRIVIETAKRGFKSDGVELNYWLVLYSRFNALRTGVSSNTKFFRKDLWKYPLSSYNYCVIFGVEEMMEKLEEKFEKELQPGSTIIACRFPLKNLQPTKILTDGGDTDTVWVYKKM